MENTTAPRKYLTLLFPVLLVLVSLFLGVRNYSPGTYLTGWDTLHPEFNFSAYWERIIGGAWQEHQGLGTVASQAHAAEIPRVVILQFFDLFFTQAQLRYAYMFLMLVLGPLGVYLFLTELFGEKGGLSKLLAAFIGASFYLLNLNTLQQFYVPLEMFPTHFAYIGWLFYFSLKVLKGDRRSLLWLAIASFFSAPQAHTSTLFMAFFLSLFVFLTFYSLQGEFLLKAKRSFAVLVVILLTNAFWLGPNIYFIVTNAKEVSESKIHSMFSDEAAIQSQEFGNVSDVAVLKGFLFNWGEHVGNGEYGDLLNEWDTYFDKTPAQYIGYFFFGLSLLGVLLALVSRERFFLAAFGLFIITYFFVANNNPPFGSIYTLMQEQVPLFKEAFRFPFTKFGSLLALSYAIFGGYALLWIFSRLEGINSGRVIVILLGVSLFFCLSYYMKPAFGGNLVSPSMKVAIPERYFELFEYFDTQEDYGRVANLPIHSFWGWVYYNWEPVTKTGYQGAGFLWFGIKQPLLDREFDRWGAANEQYYREMSYAIYSQDVELLESVLDKFDVTWIVLDKSVFQPGASDKVLFLNEIENLLKTSNLLTLEKDFGSGLHVYRVNTVSAHLVKKNQVPLVGDKFLKERYDSAYLSFGDYVVTEESKFPFVGITNLDESLNASVVSSDDAFTYLTIPEESLYLDSLVVEVFISTEGDGNIVGLRDIISGEVLVETTGVLPNTFVLDINGHLKFVDLEVVSDGEVLGALPVEANVAVELKVYEDTDVVQRFSSSFSVLEPCSVVGGQTAYTIETNKSGFNLSARNVKACVTTPLSTAFTLPDSEKFLLKTVVTAQENGAIADVCLLDELTGVCIGSYNRIEDEILLFTYLDISDIDHNYLRFFADSKDERETGVLYRDLNFSILEQSDLIVFAPFDIPPTTISPQGTLSFEKTTILTSGELRILSSPHVCGSGSRDLRDAEAVYSESGIRYTSDRDFLCDSFKLTSVNPSQGYILEVHSRNLEGLPLRLCMTNEISTRCDLHVALPKTSEFTTNYFVLSPMGEGGYTLNLTNLVFGSDNVTSNEVSYISFTPIPYKLLKDMRLGEMGERQDVLVLSEAFDPGWIGICGFSLCDATHVLVNNWANGWVFPNGQVPAAIRILYWPQIMQFFGYFVLVLTFVLLVAKAKSVEQRNL